MGQYSFLKVILFLYLKSTNFQMSHESGVKWPGKGSKNEKFKC